MGKYLLLISIICSIVFVFSDHILTKRSLLPSKKGVNRFSEKEKPKPKWLAAISKKVPYPTDTQTLPPENARQLDLFRATFTIASTEQTQAFTIKSLPYKMGTMPGASFRYKDKAENACNIEIAYNAEGYAEVKSASHNRGFMVFEENSDNYKNYSSYTIPADGNSVTIWLSANVRLALDPLSGYKNRYRSAQSKPALRLLIKHNGQISNINWEADGNSLIIGRKDIPLIQGAPLRQVEPKHLEINYDYSTGEFRLKCIAEAKDSVFSIMQNRPLSSEHTLIIGDEFGLGGNQVIMEVVDIKRAV
ncbi:MAG: hypothetical protein FWG30_03850 [Eubacteriaceae bacterium]|jgi:hypothetical protein|nr:hypothetical protein [Eubacteriaceae bacterium]